MKIYDTFCFFNEFMILDLRLNILDSYVDEFILVEARLDHQNNPKPLYFEENKEKFSKYLHKIRHVIVDNFPDHTYWSHEHYQRDYISTILFDNKVEDDAIVFVSDCDEIWNPLSIFGTNKELVKFEHGHVYRWRSKICYFYFNLVADAGDWVQPMFMTGKTIKDFYSSGLRLTVDILRNPIWKNEILYGLGGWHFSYTENPIVKLKSFVHSEYKGVSIDHINKCISNMINPFHSNPMYIIHENSFPTYFPKYIMDNMSKYQTFILK